MQGISEETVVMGIPNPIYGVDVENDLACFWNSLALSKFNTTGILRIPPDPIEKNLRILLIPVILKLHYFSLSLGWERVNNSGENLKNSSRKCPAGFPQFIVLVRELANLLKMNNFISMYTNYTIHYSLNLMLWFCLYKDNKYPDWFSCLYTFRNIMQDTYKIIIFMHLSEIILIACIKKFIQCMSYNLSLSVSKSIESTSDMTNAILVLYDWVLRFYW